MANLNAPRGFLPVKHKSGSPIVQNEYTIASGYTSNIFKGDPVMLTGTANNIQLAVGTAGTPTPDGVGVFSGCTWTDATGKFHFSSYWPASTVASDAKAMVWDDPNLVFEVQSLSCALNDLGALVDFTAAAGSALTGNSGAYVDSTTGTTAKTFRLERIVDRPDNAVGAFAKVEVTYAEHCRNVSISGVGGM